MTAELVLPVVARPRSAANGVLEPVGAVEIAEVAALTVLVMAKSPVPGQVKTRLCPPLQSADAAAVATAALLDTMEVIDDFQTVNRNRRDRTVVSSTLALAGQLTAAPGGPAIAAQLAGPTGIGPHWRRIPQRGEDFTARLVNAHADSRRREPGAAVLQLGMDTPQITVPLLIRSLELLRSPGVDGVLGPTADGGWWALGLRDPRAARVLHQVRMSTASTGAETLRVLGQAGLRIALLPTLTDVDTISDAAEVARLAPSSRFARVLRSVAPEWL